MAKYYGAITSQSFALLGLALASGFFRENSDLLSKTDDLLQKYGTPEQKEQYLEIQRFYEMISKLSSESNSHAFQEA